MGDHSEVSSSPWERSPEGHRGASLRCSKDCIDLLKTSPK